MPSAPDDLGPLDPRLEAIRRQIGEAAWADRVARARARAAIVLAAKEAGDDQAARAEPAAAGLSFSRATLATWARHYRDAGLAGLLDRRGPPATRAHEDAAPHVRKGRLTHPAPSFLKWVGSKKRVLAELLARLPGDYGTYYEPMLGSGVLFLALKPPRAVLSDANEELVGAWQVVRDDVEALLAALERHPNTSAHFHAVRALVPAMLPPVDRAARFVFLNKTCFNGLYRVNRDGRFNVPYGRIAHAHIADAEALRRVSGALAGVELRTGDLARGVEGARRGDLVYLDPPYLPAVAQRTIRYGREPFGEAEHRRLAALVHELHGRGVKVLVSNGDHPLIRALYRGFHVEQLTVRRPVNARVDRRAGFTELVIRTYPLAGEAPARRRRPARSCAQLALPLP